MTKAAWTKPALVATYVSRFGAGTRNSRFTRFSGQGAALGGVEDGLVKSPNVRCLCNECHADRTAEQFGHRKRRHAARDGWPDSPPEAYRAKWGLKPEYPMVAPAYAAKRQELAKKIGLGRKPRTPEPAPARLRRGAGRRRPPKSTRVADTLPKPPGIPVCFHPNSLFQEGPQNA